MSGTAHQGTSNLLFAMAGNLFGFKSPYTKNSNDISKGTLRVKLADHRKTIVTLPWTLEFDLLYQKNNKSALEAKKEDLV